MKLKVVLFAILICSLISKTYSQGGSQPFYEIKVYHFESKDQENTIDTYLKDAYLPALHRKGIKNIGVFKPIGNDTLQDKRIYVLIPFKSASQFADLPSELEKDAVLAANGKTYLTTAYNKPAYKRIESTLVKSFSSTPKMQLPKLKNELGKRVYELRSYESATEQAHQMKSEQFNQAGEIPLFARLGFNAVFYGSVVAGSRMPNLMYLTTFEDMDARNQHWETFKVDEEWKKLSAIERYKNTVSRNETILLSPASYSEI